MICKVTVGDGTRLVFFYRRVSSEMQERSGLGLEAQLAACQQYFDTRMKPAGFVFGGDFVDGAVSARKKPLNKREAGFAMDAQLRRGDVVVFHKLDRCFRSMQDFSNTFANWTDRGISFAIVHQNMQNWGAATNPYDKALLGMMAIFGELEAELISVRTKEAMAAKRARGDAPAGRTPAGKRRKFGNRFVNCPHERAVMAKIVEMVDKGWSTHRIYYYLKNNKITRRNGSLWTCDVIRLAYDLEFKYRQEDEARLNAARQQHEPPLEYTEDGEPPFEC